MTSGATASAAPTAAGRVLAAIRFGVNAALAFALGAVLVFALVLALPPVVGLQSMTVLSGSMEPTLETGSVVVDEVIRPTEARIGDIVTFSDPANKDRLITHRLRGARIEGGVAHMVTKGDANDAPERWDIPADGEIGRVIVNIPKLGHLRALAGSKNGYLALMVAVLGLGCWVLLDVWKRPARQES